MDAIKSFKQFQERSRKKYRTLIDNIKNDKRYLSTDQASKEDMEILGKDRAACQLNVVKNAVRTIVNTYRERPYKWKVVDVMTEKESDLLTKAGITFLSNPDNMTAATEVLESAVAFGLGVFVVTNDLGVDGQPEPVMYAIQNLDNVYLDPDISKTNGADANEAAIVELKNKRWVEQNYGIDIASVDTPDVDITEDYDRKEYMPLVTYYRKENSGVMVYRMIGNDIVESIPLAMTYIPVIPVFGEKSYDGKEYTWSGIVNQMRGVQRLINYGYSNILVRLSVSPKNQWLCESESVEGNEKFYKDSSKTLNPLLMYNKWSADGKRELEPPQRISNEVPIGDVSELFNQSLQMVNNIIGIPAIGLESETEKTATEVLTASKTFQNNIRTYIWNLRASMTVAGMCLFELISNNTLYGQIKIDMVQGPDEALKKQEARVILQGMAPLMSEPQDQRKLLLAMAKVENDNEYVNNLIEMLQPMPTAQEMKDQELLGMADNEIKQRDAQIAELQKQLADEKRQSELKGYSLDRELTLESIKHKNMLEQMILKAKLDGQLTEKDLVEMANEQEKQKMELEREAIKNEGEKMKSEAQAVKSENEVIVSDAKTRQSLAKAKETEAKTRNQIVKGIN